ncbi:hypothetical protein HU200_006637 [Digitaria exilis]|uniref:Uncharacterized protein n=1 Tax=Digitaria exilis TaxID=1010633 RepID=A0A835FPC8_9POAL|nr:hypothetical protein HU200_006637 [Digitaria exilis]
MASTSFFSPRRIGASSSSRGPVMKTLTTTRVYTFSSYSKAVTNLLPTGQALKSKPFDFHGRSWRIKLYPTGFIPATRDFVAVLVKCRTEPFNFTDAAVTVEILDKNSENAVFDDATAKMTTLATGDGGFSKGYVQLARRREVKAACVRDDGSVRVRCTLLIKAGPVAKPSVLPWRHVAKAEDDGDVGLPGPDSVASTSTGDSPDIVTGSYTLTITRFSQKKAYLVRGECVRSVQFRVGGSNWYIKVYPNGHDEGSKDSVTFFLARGRSVEPETTAEFAFELANFKEAGGNIKSARARVTFGKNANNSEHLVLQRPASELLQRDDRLIVRCKLGVFTGKPPCALLAEVPTIAGPPDDERSSDFLWLLKSQEFSDITYAAGGTTFRLHSCVLAARSPVFREEVRELVDNPEEHPWRYVNVEEENMTSQEFEALVHVVYTDQLPDMAYVEPTDEVVEAMLFAAARYEVPRLKLRCEQWLCTFVTPLTAADVLVTAVRYDLRKLEDACVRYATPDHVWEHVKQTEGFNRLRASWPHIWTAATDTDTDRDKDESSRDTRRCALDVLEGSRRHRQAGGRTLEAPMFDHVRRAPRPRRSHGTSSKKQRGRNNNPIMRGARRKSADERAGKCANPVRGLLPLTLLPNLPPGPDASGRRFAGSPLPDSSGIVDAAGDLRGMGYLSTVIGNPTDGSPVGTVSNLLSRSTCVLC